MIQTLWSLVITHDDAKFVVIGGTRGDHYKTTFSNDIPPVTTKLTSWQLSGFSESSDDLMEDVGVWDPFIDGRDAAEDWRRIRHISGNKHTGPNSVPKSSNFEQHWTVSSAGRVDAAADTVPLNSGPLVDAALRYQNASDIIAYMENSLHYAAHTWENIAGFKTNASKLEKDENGQPVLPQRYQDYAPVADVFVHLHNQNSVPGYLIHRRYEERKLSKSRGAYKSNATSSKNSFLHIYNQSQYNQIFNANLTPPEEIPHYIPDEDTIKVIIYAKYRSGSTYTGNFFSYLDDTIYMFEPLKRSHTQSSHSSPPKVIQLLETFLNCDFLHANTAELATGWLHHDVFCKPETLTACTTKGYLYALLHAQNTCRRSRIRIIKVIRIHSLYNLVPFMAKGIKVIHLVRDPRGVLTSRNTIEKQSDIAGYDYMAATMLCDSWWSDHVLAINTIMRSEYASNYHVVRYEDLAFYPVEEGRSLFAFLGIKLTDKVLSWMKLQESMSRKRWMKYNWKKHPFRTDRPNPAQASQHWRYNMSESSLEVIQDCCGLFMKSYGYKELQGDKLKDVLTPAVIDITNSSRSYIPTGQLQ